MQAQEKTSESVRFALAVEIPSGLTEAEFKNTVRAMMFALNGAARIAGVELLKGAHLTSVINTHLTDA